MSEGALMNRDGHLSELTLFRLADGELSAEERGLVERHLASCGLCLGHTAALRTELARPLPALKLPSFTAVNSPQRTTTRRLQGWAPAAATILSLAAVMLVFLRPPSQPDQLSLRGAGLHLEVYREAGAGAERLRSGDAVAPGDRLVFRVRAQEAGQILVFGLDSTGSAYPVWPADPSLRSAAVEGASTQDLRAGVELDATGSAERFIATRCDTAFTAADLYPSLGAADPLPSPTPGCSAAEILLSKRAPPP